MAAPPILHPEAALSLMLAVISSSITPLLLVDERLHVVVASGSFCKAFGLDPATVTARAISELGTSEWKHPQLTSLLEATAAGAAEVDAYEMDLDLNEPKPRRLVVRAHKLDYSDKDQVRLLVAVTDVTQARADEKFKDDLVREKDILLREVQHRVANSLQIIASGIRLT